MNTDNYHYLANKAYRDEVMRQANRQRLSCQTARKAMPRTVAAGLLMLWHALFR